MRHDKIQISEWGLEEHPSTELLRQYEEGALSPENSHALERHLLDCELCEDILSGMALADRRRTQQSRNRIWQRIKTRLRHKRRRTRALHGLADWRVALGLLMMFSSLGLLLFYHYTRTAQERAAMQASEVLPPSPEELLARTIDAALVLDIPAPPDRAGQHLPASRSTHPAGTSTEVLQGQVLSPDGVPLTQVSITLKGHPQTTTNTDQQGFFRLAVPAAAAYTLRLQVPGSQPQEMEVMTSETPLKLQLHR